jgi:hypothetical protein
MKPRPLDMLIKSQLKLAGTGGGFMARTMHSIYQAVWITSLIALVIYVVRQMFKRD